MTNIIKIKVKNCKLKPISEFENFQGNLKVLNDEAKDKLKQSIIRNGFNAPIFIWAGHNYILDGHQRIIAVKELLAEGYELETGDQLPYVEIEAENEQQAAEMVLTYNSQYGEILSDRLNEYISTFNLDVDDLIKITTMDIKIDDEVLEKDLSILDDTDKEQEEIFEEKLYFNKEEYAVYSAWLNEVVKGKRREKELIRVLKNELNQTK